MTKRLLVVSHPAVVQSNRAVYEKMRELGWAVRLVTPHRWKHEYAARAFAPLPSTRDLTEDLRPQRIVGVGKGQAHVYIGRLRSRIAAYRPDFVLVEQEPFSLPAVQWGQASLSAGVPFGVQQDENLDRTFPLPARLARAFSLRRAELVLARSESAAELAARWGAQGHVAVVPHAVPLWEGVEPDRGHRKDVFTVGFAGRLVEEKGIRDLLSALSQVTFNHKLLVVGDGPLRPLVEKYGSAFGSVEVQVGVQHDDMPEQYARMDVLVLPSRTTARWAEQFGRVLVEAPWCGTPVVGSSSGEIPWVINSSGGGWIFPEGNVKALAERLTFLNANPDARTLRAAQGRASVLANFSDVSCAEATAAAIEHVLH